jgi:hypothetical protein
MKKIILTAIVAVFSIFSATISKAETSEAEVRNELSIGMANLVDDFRESYQQGMSYQSFKTNMFRNHVLPGNGGEKIMQSVFNYLAAGANYEYIVANDNGNGLAYLCYALNSTGNVEEALDVTFGQDFENTQGGIAMREKGKFKKWLIGAGNWLLENVVGPVLVAVLINVLTP